MWRLTLAGQTVNAPDAQKTAYAAPAVTTISPAASLIPTNGGTTVTLAGSNLGPASNSPEWARLGASVSAVYGPATPFNLYSGQPCSVVSHTQMTW